ncbi:MAG TPA: xylulose 5-phosphate 3-epimerase, partial [Hyphomicrobiaceae bacterium]|nr:xylulose 5-phosphate 3-epimerase [Hyphomicrobiaceae bacterium]
MSSDEAKPARPSSASDWFNGYGVISHTPETRSRITELAERLVQRGAAPDTDWVFGKLAAADRLASAGMWVVAHMTYARTVDVTGRALAAEDFKPTPEGHTGGSLNMVPAYVGYLLANVLTGKTRSWIMGQGHCVAAIEAVNALTGNLSPGQVGRYDATTEGLSRLAQDFYSYAVGADGRPAAPIGSHVNAHTAGGISEGGYLGFAEVEYVHMPLKGESLVAFLSDGAFEEQRGSDWSPRWWRSQDCGAVVPIMILNGRRIEQRTEIAQEGGADWLRSHLQMSGFDPLDIDGRDPCAFAWAIIEAEERLSALGDRPPPRLPYVIASTIKGFGFPGAGTNRAHNLPLEGNPHVDASARDEFNAGAKQLWVSPQALAGALEALTTHEAQGRPLERDHALARRNVELPVFPEPDWHPPGRGPISPMAAIDAYFVRLVEANPHLRPRVGNPDELASNQMGTTLKHLKHRVLRPESSAPEAVDGAVITALNEEAVIGAALGNKGGINIAVTYEAFAVKMVGAVRQDIIFARHQKELGRGPRWLGVPLVVTSHTWENGKNEQSHQDPTMPEALLGEMSDTSRVLFPIDSNTAIASLAKAYQGHAQICCLVVPKRPQPVILDASAAREAVSAGAITISGDPRASDVQLVAIGAYQVQQALRAQQRLEANGCRACVTAIIEPGRFREPRDDLELSFVIDGERRAALFPDGPVRVIVTHTRPEPMLGVLRPIDGGPAQTRALGYHNRG